MRWLRRRKRKVIEIEPDEIFLDASNTPAFERERMEGRLERPLSRATYLGAIGVFLLITALFLGQAWNLQVVQGEAYAAQSERNRLKEMVVFADRGTITDRNGVVLAENAPREGESFPRRIYPESHFGNLLGYVNYPKRDSSGNFYATTTVGVAGVEASFDRDLSGKNGLVLTEEDALGVIQSQGAVTAPVAGKNTRLSIDARAQRAFASSIAELAERVPFSGGAGILMDVETGEVLALTSYPEFDSNVLAEGAPRDLIENYQKDSRRPFLNRPLAGLYAPGSVVKPFVASGALTDRIISPDKIIVSTGSLVVPNPYDASKPSVFKDWKALGPMDMIHAIAFSSDVYFYTVGGGFGDQEGLGIERLAYWFRAFGFGKQTGIELLGEGAGLVPDPAWKEETFGEPWRLGDTYFTAIGQYAITVTPLEMVRAIAAIANDGKLVRPTILADAPLAGESISVDASALRIVQSGMRLGAVEGTGAGLNVPFVRLAVKTGTAELGVSKAYVNSWAVGFFPYEHPRYAFAVVMERGSRNNLIGGVFAVRTALERLYASAPEYFR